MWHFLSQLTWPCSNSEVENSDWILTLMSTETPKNFKMARILDCISSPRHLSITFNPLTEEWQVFIEIFTLWINLFWVRNWRNFHFSLNTIIESFKILFVCNTFLRYIQFHAYLEYKNSLFSTYSGYYKMQKSFPVQI